MHCRHAKTTLGCSGTSTSGCPYSRRSRLAKRLQGSWMPCAGSPPGCRLPAIGIMPRKQARRDGAFAVGMIAWLAGPAYVPLFGSAKPFDIKRIPRRWQARLCWPTVDRDDPSSATFRDRWRIDPDCPTCCRGGASKQVSGFGTVLRYIFAPREAQPEFVLRLLVTRTGPFDPTGDRGVEGCCIEPQVASAASPDRKRREYRKDTMSHPHQGAAVAASTTALSFSPASAVTVCTRRSPLAESV